MFTASDGTKFTDRNAWRKYEFETNYTLRNKKDEKLMKLPGKIQGQPFDISDLERCEVLLLDHSDQVQIDNLKDCRVFVGPSAESVFVRNCSNCVFTIACKQLRTRDCLNCKVSLYSLTDPIIETSQQMSFSAFNGAYNGIKQHFEAARLEPTNNHWSQVYDFNDPDKTGRNWRILTSQEEEQPWVIDLKTCLPGAEALGPCENPVPKDAGFIQYVENGSNGGMQAFSLTTSQKEAEKVIHDSTPLEHRQPTLAPAPLPPAPTVPKPAQVPTSTFLAPPAAPVAITNQIDVAVADKKSEPSLDQVSVEACPGVAQ